MHQAKEEITRIEKYVKNMQTIVFRFAQSIGMTPDKSKLKATGVEVSEEYNHLEGLYELQSERQGTKKQLKNNDEIPYYVDHNIGVDGVNQHLENPYLFLSFSPEKSQPNLNKRLSMVGENSAKIKKEFTEQFCQDTFLRIQRLHRVQPDKPIRMLILGDRDWENFQTLKEIVKPIETNLEEQDGLIEQYSLEIGFGEEGKSISVSAYYLNAYTEEGKPIIELSSKALSALYAIYYHSLAKKEPLLIMSPDGLHRAPIVAFAFEILRKFNTTFPANSNMSDVVKNLNDIFDTLRRSRSPQALSHYADVEQSLYLAFGLKIAELNMQLVSNLKKITLDRDGDSLFQSRAAVINQIIQNLNHQPTDLHRAAVINCAFLGTEYNLLSTYPPINWRPSNTSELLRTFSSIGGTITKSEPEYLTLLRDLEFLLDRRSKAIEPPLFSICGCEEIASACENVRKERFDGERQSEVDIATSAL
jgi:hypothetical protein